MWGAQGGKWGDVLGGKGGFSHGKYSINKATTIYVSVGGGEGKIWNGGGGGITGPAGGGATSVQTSLRSDGQLIYYETVKNTDVLIVAGGGGGSEWYYDTNNSTQSNGGVGGGINGGDGHFGFLNGQDPCPGGKGATQSGGGQSAALTGIGGTTSITNGSFGKGGSSLNGDGGGNGGGGWYGGGAASFAGGGGGGSGHIGTMLTNGATIAGNQPFPSPTGGTETGHSGNGYCKITWMPVL